MKYVHLSPLSAVAETEFKEFIEDNKAVISRAARATPGVWFAVIGKDEHWFMGHRSFETWRIGRTYKLY